MAEVNLLFSLGRAVPLEERGQKRADTEKPSAARCPRAPPTGRMRALFTARVVPGSR
jgi:hypothetical protein